MPQYVEAYGQTLEFPDGMSEAEMAKAIKRNALSIGKQDDRSTAGVALDKAGAVASGFNRAYLSRAGLPFNPVDAAANVQDLVKAAIGAPYIALTGKPPPDWLVLNDRASVPGSGEWIINQARKTKFVGISKLSQLVEPRLTHI